MELIQIWAEANVLTQILALLIVVYMVIKGIIKVPFIPIGNKKVGNGQVADHSACSQFPSLRLLVISAIEKSAEIQRIQINDALAEQMNEADDLFVDVRDILRAHFLKLFRAVRGGELAGLLEEPEVHHYVSILDNTETMLKEMTRRYLKLNHFIEKSDEEFRLYIEKRTEDYQKAVSRYLDEHYETSSFTISREELFDSNMQVCLAEIAKKVTDFFYRVRTIAIEKQEQVENLRNDIKEFL